MELNSDADAIGLYQGQESVQVLVLPKSFIDNRTRIHPDQKECGELFDNTERDNEVKKKRD